MWHRDQKTGRGCVQECGRLGWASHSALNENTLVGKHTTTRWEPPVNELLMNCIFIRCTLCYSGFLINMLSGTNSNAVQTSNAIAFINQVHNLIKRRRQPGLTGCVTCAHYLIGIIYTTLHQSVSRGPYQQCRYSAAQCSMASTGAPHLPGSSDPWDILMDWDGQASWRATLEMSFNVYLDLVSEWEVLHPPAAWLDGWVGGLP